MSVNTSRRMFTLEQITEGMRDNLGYCLACGAACECCEPDARRYDCEECGEPKVYGAEELLRMGRVNTEDL
jgi:hypothetical protein